MGPERQILNGQGPFSQPAGDSSSFTTGTLTTVRDTRYSPRKKRLTASSSPTAMKQLYCTAPKKTTNNDYVRLVQPSAQSGSLSTGVPGVHTHCIAEEILQSAPLNVLSEEIQLLVLVQHTNELQHIGVVQAAHHLHLQAETSHPKK